MTMKSVLIVLLLLITPAAQAQNGSQLLVGVEGDTPKAEVSIVLVNEPQARSKDFYCAVTSIWSRSGNTGLLTGDPVLIALKPGKYAVTYEYQTHIRRSIGGARNHEFEAGKTYKVSCKGKTYNQMKLVILAQDA